MVADGALTSGGEDGSPPGIPTPVSTLSKLFRRLASLCASSALALALASVPSTACADDLEKAKEWVTEGDKAEAAHDYKTAIEKYKLALKVKATAALYLRLGLVQEEAGDLA